MFIFHILSSTSYFLWASFVDITRHARGRGLLLKAEDLECNLMNIDVTLSHRRQMPVFVFGSNPNLRQCARKISSAQLESQEGPNKKI